MTRLAALALAVLLCAGWRVIDGDTVEIGGEIVRLANIDTPETGPRALCEAERRLGNLAKARLKALMGAGAVRLVRGDPADGRLKDRHGRTLALVYAGGVEVGAVLVSEGLARPWTGRRLPWCGGEKR